MTKITEAETTQLLAFKAYIGEVYPHLCDGTAVGEAIAAALEGFLLRRKSRRPAGKWWVRNRRTGITGRKLCPTDMENYEKETNEETGAMAKIPKTLALAFDGSDYHAGLRTRCNFGCVQYEAIARSGNRA